MFCATFEIAGEAQAKLGAMTSRCFQGFAEDAKLDPCLPRPWRIMDAISPSNESAPDATPEDAG